MGLRQWDPCHVCVHINNAHSLRTSFALHRVAVYWGGVERKRRTNSEVELTGVSGRGQEGLQAVAYLPHHFSTVHWSLTLGSDTDFPHVCARTYSV